VPGFKHIFYGADYNPEQWDRSTWKSDMALMKEAGVNMVTVNVFSWAKLEPREGQFTFDWLDEIIDLLHSNGIRVDLATATASPPAWLSLKYPESLPRDGNMVVYNIGSRQHYCPNSEAYRDRSAALVTELASRYGRHPAVAMWHVNNEISCHIPACYCDVCAAKFRQWLQAKYKDVDALNDAWGTSFWSQHYSDWTEIMPPRKAPSFHNPTQSVDYKRFTSDSFLALYKLEHEIIRTHAHQPITTNLMGFHDTLDLFAWAPHLDFTSYDSYPDPSRYSDEHVSAAMSHDLTRSLNADGRPFVLMEQAPSAVNWRDNNVPKEPGMMRVLSYQAIARGADGCMFFQWRASASGAEKYHSAFVQHTWNKENRIWKELVHLGTELRLSMDGVVASRFGPVTGRVGILFDWNSKWAAETPSKPTKIDVMNVVYQYYRIIYEQNRPVSFVHPHMKLSVSEYPVLIAPLLYMISPASAQALKEYVAGGGMLVVTYFSGIVDENDGVQVGGYPALLREVLGLWVEEFEILASGASNQVKITLPMFDFHKGRPLQCSGWCDVIHLETAQPIGVYTSSSLEGFPAITFNRYGTGLAYYIGTRVDYNFLVPFLHRICNDANIFVPPWPVPSKIEVASREHRDGDRQRYWFVLNHNDKHVAFDMGAWRGQDILTGNALTGGVEMDPYGVLVLTEIHN